jgi:outer membrane protein assembly factor BamB
VSVTARNAATGALRWIRDLADPDVQYRVYVVAAEDHRVFLLGQRYADGAPGNDPVWSEAMLLALDGRSGETLWSDFFNLAGGPDQGHSIAVAGGRVVVTASDWVRGQATGYTMPDMVVRGYDAATGALLWQDLEPRTVPKRLVVNGGRVFTLSETTRKPLLIAHDLETGERLWQRRTGKVHGDFLGAARQMVVVYGSPYLGDFDDTRFRVYDGETGRLVRQWKDGSSAEQMIASRRRLYTVGVPSLSGNGLAVNAYRLGSGRKSWSYRRDESDIEEQGCRAIMHRGVLVTTSTEFPGETVTAFEQ